MNAPEGCVPPQCEAKAAIRTREHRIKHHPSPRSVTNHSALTLNTFDHLRDCYGSAAGGAVGLPTAQSLAILLAEGPTYGVLLYTIDSSKLPRVSFFVESKAVERQSPTSADLSSE